MRMDVVSICKPHWPLSRQADLRLPVTSFAETEELEDDSVCPSGEKAHAGLQLLVPPLKGAVDGPQVLNCGHIEEVVLRQPRVEGLEFICVGGTRRKPDHVMAVQWGTLEGFVLLELMRDTLGFTVVKQRRIFKDIQLMVNRLHLYTILSPSRTPVTSHSHI